jgi:membrane-bound lytic murein transglycosylase B
VETSHIHCRHGREAQAQGISRNIIDRAFASLTPDPAVLSFDRRQRGTAR